MPDKHEVGGSSPLGPTSDEKSREGKHAQRAQMLIENRIKKERNEQIVVLRRFFNCEIRRSFLIIKGKKQFCHLS